MAIPQGEGEVEKAMPVAQAGDAVLAPAIGPAVCMVEGKTVPCVAIGGVVLADRAPLATGNIGPPLAPGRTIITGDVDAILLGCAGCCGVGWLSAHCFILTSSWANAGDPMHFVRDSCRNLPTR